MSNTVLKVTRRTIAELVGLQMGVVENSYRTFSSNTNIDFNSKDMSNSTPITQVERRFISELKDLLYSSIEYSHKKYNISYLKIRRTNPHKKYKIKLKVIKKYNNKMEV